jgi:hypothetical protein
MVDKFLQPLQQGFGEYLGEFYAGILPLTKQIEEFSKRGQESAMGWASGRMVDDAEKMLAQWGEDSGDGSTPGTRLPAILVALDGDMVLTGRDYIRQVSDPIYVRLSDEDARIFKLRTITNDQRAQVVIAAHDMTTAKAIAGQLLLFMDSKRRFNSVHSFAGHDLNFEVLIETPDSPASKIETESKNLTLLAVDLALKATIPLFSAPAEGEPNDGSGLTPPGYPVVLEVADANSPPPQILG